MTCIFSLFYYDMLGLTKKRGQTSYISVHSLSAADGAGNGVRLEDLIICGRNLIKAVKGNPVPLDAKSLTLFNFSITPRAPDSTGARRVRRRTGLGVRQV